MHNACCLCLIEGVKEYFRPLKLPSMSRQSKISTEAPSVDSNSLGINDIVGLLEQVHNLNGGIHFMRSKVPVVGHFVGCAIMSRTSAPTEIKTVNSIREDTHKKVLVFCSQITKRGGKVNYSDH